MKAVQVDVIAYAPTAFFHCRHREITFQQMGIGAWMRRIEAAESLPPDDPSGRAGRAGARGRRTRRRTGGDGARPGPSAVRA